MEFYKMLEAVLPAIAGIAGKGIDAFISNQNAEKNVKYQREFAQNGIQWRAADAEKAGIHPLAAMGASLTNFSPVSVGSNFGDAGQDITRAIHATRTEEQRVSAVTDTMQQLQIQNMGLQNDLLASQIAKLNASLNPPFPGPAQQWLIDGQGQTQIKEDPFKRQSTNPGNPSQEAGAIADVGYTRTPSGWAPAFSKDLQDRSDENHLGAIAWAIRNMVLPSIGTNYNPPTGIPLDNDQEWYYDPIRQQYVKVKSWKSMMDRLRR